MHRWWTEAQCRAPMIFKQKTEWLTAGTRDTQAPGHPCHSPLGKDPGAVTHTTAYINIHVLYQVVSPPPTEIARSKA